MIIFTFLIFLKISPTIQFNSKIPEYILPAEYESGVEHVILGYRQLDDYYKVVPEKSELIKMCLSETIPSLFPKFICALLHFYRDPRTSKKNYFWEYLLGEVPRAVQYLKRHQNYFCGELKSTVVGFTPNRIHVGCVDSMESNPRSGNDPKFDTSFVMEHDFPTAPTCANPEEPCVLRSYIYVHYIVVQDKICCCPKNHVCMTVVHSQPKTMLPLLIETIRFLQLEQ